MPNFDRFGAAPINVKFTARCPMQNFTFIGAMTCRPCGAKNPFLATE